MEYALLISALSNLQFSDDYHVAAKSPRIVHRLSNAALPDERVRVAAEEGYMITVGGANGYTGRKTFAGTVSPLVIMVGFLLLGCETTVISANPRQVIVKSSMNDVKESQRLAEAECGKHERYARMALKATNTDPNYTFDCVQ